jgi:hypothetical protein
MSAMVRRVRRARWPTGLGLASRDPSRPTYSIAHGETHLQHTSKPTHGETHDETPSTAKTHPHPPTRQNPPTSKPHPRRNPPTTHVKTHPHRNPWRNPIHGENHPRRGSCGSSQVHERSLPARRVWPSSLRGSFVFLFFFFLRAIQCIRIYVILMYFFSFF